MAGGAAEYEMLILRVEVLLKSREFAMSKFASSLSQYLPKDISMVVKDSWSACDSVFQLVFGALGAIRLRGLRRYFL